MRIIAGEKRGTKLLSPQDERVRPTTDRVKEALFGSLQFDIPGANVLDLFAGSGALGIEAFSRGARQAVLVDADADSVDVIRKNIARVGNPPHIKIVKNDYEKAIRLFQNTEKFDIVIVDPPYHSGLYESAAAALVRNGVLADGAVVVMESACALDLDICGLLCYKTKRFGTVYLTYYRFEG